MRFNVAEWRDFRSAFFVAAFVALCGCPSITNLKTARALDQGEYELTVAPEVGVMSVPSSPAYSNLSSVYPQLEVAGRVGVVDGFDLGLELYLFWGAELDATIQLVRGKFALTLDPGVGILGGQTEIDLGESISGPGQGGDYLSVPIHLDLVAGVELGHGHQLVFGPGFYVVYTHSHSSGGRSFDQEYTSEANAVTVLAGGTVGVSFAVSPTFRIMPEFDIYFPVAGALSTGTNLFTGYTANGAFIYAFALGFSFGNGPRESRTVPVPEPRWPGF